MKIDNGRIEKGVKDSYELPNRVLESIPKPLVTVHIITYQHGSYIKKCIEGVLMQKVNFPFEIIIGEDFSTDKTREIVFDYAKKYPQKIRVITADYNVKEKANTTRCMRRARGKYIAICEGDDYWTSPYKLQKQADVMEKDDSIAIAAHRIEYIDEEKQHLFPKFSKEEKEIGNIFDILERNYLFACSVMIRRSMIPFKKVERVSSFLIQGDWPLLVFTAENGKIYFSNEIMAVYRLHKGGIWSSLPIEKKAKFAIEARKAVIREIKGLSKSKKRAIFFNSNLRWSKRAFSCNKNLAFFLLIRAFFSNPLKTKEILETGSSFVFDFLRFAIISLKKSKLGKISAGKILIDAFLWPFDFISIMRKYKKQFKCFPNIFSPKTFNEKIQRNKLFYRKKRHIIFADKIAVRNYVADKIGEDFLTKVYWTGKNLRDIEKEKLPKKFVIKSNHASSQIIFVKDKDNFDWEKANKEVKRWLDIDHSLYRGEWQYRWINPSILVEEYLEGKEENDNVPLDYKFFCFNGKVKIFQIDFNRFSNHSRLLFDRDFNLLNVRLRRFLYDKKVKKPACFSKMIEIAEKLSQGEPFLRIDLYDAKKPIFGEITLHPGAGLEKFYPKEWDLKIGQLMP